MVDLGNWVSLLKARDQPKSKQPAWPPPPTPSPPPKSKGNWWHQLQSVIMLINPHNLSPSLSPRSFPNLPQIPIFHAIIYLSTTWTWEVVVSIYATCIQAQNPRFNEGPVTSFHATIMQLEKSHESLTTIHLIPLHYFMHLQQ